MQQVKKVELVDKSAEWLAWRKTGIGSSDAPIIMGVSPYKTPYQLWEEKTGRAENDQTGSYITDKGNRLEPVARAKYELLTGHEMPAGQFQHGKYPFVLVSMDGHNQQIKKGIEIKYMGKEDHMKASKGIIPQKYIPQVQHQLLGTGLESIDFISYNPEFADPNKTPDPCVKDLVIVNVKPDIEFITNLLVQESYFWNCVQSDTPPELTDKDFKLLKKPEQIKAATDYLAALAAQELAMTEFAEKTKDLQKLVDDAASVLVVAEKALLDAAGKIPRVEFGETGVTVKDSWRKGTVDYSIIPVLQGLDLEQYRKKSTSSRKIEVPKKKKPAKQQA